MHTEPDLDPRGLVELLRDRYRLDVERLAFVPHGIDSWSYVATCRDAERVFVKLSRRPGRPGQTAGTPRWSEMPLLAALADLGTAHVPRPIADRDGGFRNAVAGFDVRILEYLDGRSLEDEAAWPDALYGRVAETVAAVHASTGSVRHLVERTERYELPFLPGLRAALRGLTAGEPLPAADDPALAELRTRLVPRAVEVETTMARLEQLRERARTRDGDDVMCHTDIWGSNLLLSSDGTLHLLDWDGALIGPAEGDLFMFAGTGFFPADRLGWFLDRYEAAFRPGRLAADVFGFYVYRRNLEDLADFVASILDGRTDALAPTETLGYIGALLDEQAHLDERIRLVRAVLDARGGPAA